MDDIEAQDELEMREAEINTLRKIIDGIASGFVNASDKRPEIFGLYLTQLAGGAFELAIYYPWCCEWRDRIGCTLNVRKWMTIPK